jgi:hypothetical protein
MLSHSRAECADLIAAREAIALVQSPLPRGSRSSGTQSTPSLNCTAFYSAILSPARVGGRPTSIDAFTSPVCLDSATCFAEPERVACIRDVPVPSAIIPHRSLLQELDEQQENPEEPHDKSASASASASTDSTLRHRRGGSFSAATDAPDFKPESGHLEHPPLVGMAARASTSFVVWNAAFLTLLITLILLVLLFPARLCGIIPAQLHGRTT